jgi:hypothetical protein
MAADLTQSQDHDQDGRMAVQRGLSKMLEMNLRKGTDFFTIVPLRMNLFTWILVLFSKISYT